MKAIQSLFLAAALTAAGFTATQDAQAAGHAFAAVHGGHGSGGHWGGGRYWGPRVGFYIGAPVLFSSWYWGYPYDYYYPRTVVFDRVLERYPASYSQGVMESGPATEVPLTAFTPAPAPASMTR